MYWPYPTKTNHSRQVLKVQYYKSDCLDFFLYSMVICVFPITFPKKNEHVEKIENLEEYLIIYHIHRRSILPLAPWGIIYPTRKGPRWF